MGGVLSKAKKPLPGLREGTLRLKLLNQKMKMK
jgi:hypothetical protein